MSDANPAGDADGEPDAYLAEGWRDDNGAIREALTGLAAFGVASRLKRSEVPAPWPAAVLEALRQVLPETAGPAPERIALGLEEALDLGESMLDEASPEALDDWLAECAAYVEEAPDLEAFLTHLQAVVRQYAALVAVSTGEPG